MKNTPCIAAISSFVLRRFPPPSFREKTTGKSEESNQRPGGRTTAALRLGNDVGGANFHESVFAARARNESAVQEQKEVEEVEVQQQQQQEVVAEEGGECRWTRDEEEAREGGWVGGWVVRGCACTRLRIR